MLCRRAAAQQVARQCAAVVQTRNRILWAKGVIVTWWRRQKARKQIRIAKTKNGPSKPRAIWNLSRPGLKSGLPVAIPKQQAIRPNNASTHQKQSTGAMFDESADYKKEDEPPKDLWLSL
jgi:hypothetical protein